MTTKQTSIDTNVKWESKNYKTQPCPANFTEVSFPYVKSLKLLENKVTIHQCKLVGLLEELLKGTIEING